MNRPSWTFGWEAIGAIAGVIALIFSVIIWILPLIPETTPETVVEGDLTGLWISTDEANASVEFLSNGVFINKTAQLENRGYWEIDEVGQLCISYDIGGRGCSTLTIDGDYLTIIPGASEYDAGSVFTFRKG